jgi:hypothetical protein
MKYFINAFITTVLILSTSYLYTNWDVVDRFVSEIVYHHTVITETLNF